jgi:hypothetical protein
MIFINILIFFSPYYNKNEKRDVGVVIKNISLMKQFIMFYNSIKLNFKKYDYRISIVHSTQFNNNDLEILKNLDVDLIYTTPPPNFEEWRCGQKRYCVETKIKGTHRLIAETDMLMLKEPNFNLDVDFQAMFTNEILFSKNICDLFINDYKLKKFDESYYSKKNIFNEYYINNTNYKSIFPHFNNGLILIKEEFSHKVYNKMIELDIFSIRKKNYIVNNNFLNQYIFELIMGPLLLSLTDNWMVFDKGINFLIKTGFNNFKKKDVQFLHYCGINSCDYLYKFFKDDIIKYSK